MIFTSRIKAVIAVRATREAEVSEAEKKAEIARLEADRLRKAKDDAWPQAERKVADAEILAERLEQGIAEAVRNADPYLAQEIINWANSNPEKSLQEIAQDEEDDVKGYILELL